MVIQLDVSLWLRSLEIFDTHSTFDNTLDFQHTPLVTFQLLAVAVHGDKRQK